MIPAVVARSPDRRETVPQPVVGPRSFILSLITTKFVKKSKSLEKKRGLSPKPQNSCRTSREQALFLPQARGDQACGRVGQFNWSGPLAPWGAERLVRSAPKQKVRQHLMWWRRPEPVSHIERSCMHE
jgi:hypothetical protein